MLYQIGNFNISVYSNTVFDNGKGYYLVCIDKFDDKNQYVGHKHYYFTYLPLEPEFTPENVTNLWNFPIGTKINGQRIIWEPLK